MVSSSKLLPPTIAELGCSHILHPWTKSCLRAYLDMYMSSCFGSCGYFAALYLFQFLVQTFKKKKKFGFKDLLVTYTRSCLLFASAVASCFIGVSCLLRFDLYIFFLGKEFQNYSKKILGRFYYHSIVLVPATVAALAISAETRSNKDFFSTVFANLALESLYNEMKEIRRFTWSANEQTLAFMVLTAALSYLLQEVQSKSRHFWFFTPPTIRVDQGLCFHKGSCSESIIKKFTKYFSTGFFLKALKLIFSSYSRPKTIFVSLFKPKTYAFAFFLGFYALIYQSLRCFLYKKERRYSPLHDIISGFLSGATYRLEPNISIFNSAFITILQIVTEAAHRKNFLPNLPYRELVFAISAGQLFHTRFFTPQHCPPLMHYIMSSVTGKKSDYISNNYNKLCRQL